MVVQLSRCDKTEPVGIDRWRRNVCDRGEPHKRRQRTGNIEIVGDQFDESFDIADIFGVVVDNISSDIDRRSVFGHRDGFVNDHKVVVVFIGDHNNIEREQNSIGRTLGNGLIERKVRRSDC